MNQIIQSSRTGEVSVAAIPDPIARAGQVLIANACSVISAGTEKMTMELARKSLLGKARERPDLVRRTIEKLKQEGFFSTLAQVSERLDEPMPLGYSSAGTVLAVGAGVQAFKPGDRVASNGPHAGIVSVPQHLCAAVPENVPLEQAAFTVLGAIALQGVRLAGLQLGETAFVIGLGLIGQLTVALLKMQGCRVIATDLEERKCELALRMGAERAMAVLHPADVLEFTGGLGADAVLITAATKSDGPVELAGETVRKKGRVVAVGAVGLNLPRRPYYYKEADFVVSCSYGPGRYDPFYEEQGRDYPPAYVRWTEQRNMQAVLGLMASGRLDVAHLISHRFKIDDAEAAYQLIETNREPYLGIVLEYPEAGERKPTLGFHGEPSSGKIGVGCIGAGTFARGTLLPALRKAREFRLRALCSAGGLSASRAARKFGFEVATTDEDQLIADEGVRAVFILTRHDQHAQQVIKALRAGKHVFVEKPLCLTVEELEKVENALHSAIPNPQSAIGDFAISEPSPLAPRPSLLMVGYNRRFSPAAEQVKKFFSRVREPLTVSIRFNAGAIAKDHWTQDELVGGGRIVGEACHAIDLAAFLAGSRPIRVYAESVSGPAAAEMTDDQCFITLKHANGAVSSIAYLAGGDRAYPKERVEVIGGGRVGVIEDFSQVTLCGRGAIGRKREGRQDKGHLGELDAFVQALVRGGPAPIPWEDLRATTLASILAVQSLREGVPFEIQ